MHGRWTRMFGSWRQDWRRWSVVGPGCRSSRARTHQKRAGRRERERHELSLRRRCPAFLAPPREGDDGRRSIAGVYAGGDTRRPGGAAKRSSKSQKEADEAINALSKERGAPGAAPEGRGGLARWQAVKESLGATVASRPAWRGRGSKAAIRAGPRVRTEDDAPLILEPLPPRRQPRLDRRSRPRDRPSTETISPGRPPDERARPGASQSRGSSAPPRRPLVGSMRSRRMTPDLRPILRAVLEDYALPLDGDHASRIGRVLENGLRLAADSGDRRVVRLFAVLHARGDERAYRPGPRPPRREFARTLRAACSTCRIESSDSCIARAPATRTSDHPESRSGLLGRRPPRLAGRITPHPSRSAPKRRGGPSPRMGRRPAKFRACPASSSRSGDRSGEVAGPSPRGGSRPTRWRVDRIPGRE